MAAFFLLLAILVGVVLGDALVENDNTGTLTLFGQTTERFDDGQLMLVFAGLGFLLALLLGLSLASTRRRRTRRRELRSSARELEARTTELERDNARLQDDLARRDEALAGREAELAHRDRQLALKDEELARREQEPADREREPARTDEELARRDEEAQREQEAHREREARRGQELHGAGARAATVGNPVPAAGQVEEPGAPRTEVLHQAAAPPSEVAGLSGGRRAEGAERVEVFDPDLIVSPEEPEPVAPLHDEPPWLSEGDDDSTRPLTRPDGPVDRAEAGSGRASDDEGTRLPDKPDQTS